MNVSCTLYFITNKEITLEDETLEKPLKTVVFVV